MERKRILPILLVTALVMAAMVGTAVLANPGYIKISKSGDDEETLTATITVNSPPVETGEMVQLDWVDDPTGTIEVGDKVNADIRVINNTNDVIERTGLVLKVTITEGDEDPRFAEESDASSLEGDLDISYEEDGHFLLPFPDMKLAPNYDEELQFSMVPETAGVWEIEMFVIQLDESSGD